VTIRCADFDGDGPGRGAHVTRGTGVRAPVGSACLSRVGRTLSDEANNESCISPPHPECIQGLGILLCQYGDDVAKGNSV
jgi:hypothetical protein